jgi:putative endonuclease
LRTTNPVRFPVTLLLAGPVKLVWSEYFPQITDAIATERKIKGWSRAKKEALANNDWDSIVRLSKRRAGKPR